MADISPADTPAQISEDSETKFVQPAKRPASNVATDSCATCSNHHDCELMKLKRAFKPTVLSR
jgi:hypothetical protein